MPDSLFQDRHDAGRKLATKLTAYVGHPKLLVLALSGGSLAVAYEVAMALHAPLDIFLVRSLAVPDHGDLSMGAIGSGGVTVFDQNVTRPLDIPYSVIDEAIQREKKEIDRLEKIYHPERPPLDPENKTVILVDDGLCTGAMMADAATCIRDQGAVRVIIALPIAMPETYAAYDNYDETDTIICAETPHAYRGMDTWYGDNSPVSDEEIHKLLERAAEHKTTS